MLRKMTVSIIVAAATMFATTAPGNAATATSLLVPASTAFAVLGHSCGGIQEQAFATGFETPSGLPTGDVYLQTRCGGSGRGGGYRSTTYSAWVAVTWDFTGAVASSAALSGAPANLDPALAAFDSSGNEVSNALSAINVLPAACTVGNTTYCTYRAYLSLDPGFVAPPRLLSASVASGPASGGTSVALTGTGLTGATAVDFGNAAAASFVVNSDTSITAVAAPAAAGTVDITVTTAGGTSATGAADQFTFVAAPGVSIADASALEGNKGTRQLRFVVTLTQPSATKVTMHYAVTAGTATGAAGPGSGVDFRLKAGTLTFAPSALSGLTAISKVVTVTVYGDTVPEPDDTLAVTLSNPKGGYQIDRAVATGTILNDD